MRRLTITVAPRHSLLTPALALAILLTACSTPPQIPALQSPPPLPIPSVSLSPRIIEQAGAYLGYVAQARTISADFTAPDQVASALTRGESFEPQQLRRDAIAYAAMLALQDPAFVAGVRLYFADPEQRRQVIAELYRNPAYAVGFKGSDSAAGRIIAKVGEAGTQIYAAGQAVKQAAYDVQHQAWSKADVPNRDERLARAKSISAAIMMSPRDPVSTLQRSDSSITYPVAPPYTPLVTRGLAVAALAALGEAGDTNDGTTMLMMAEPGTDTCLNLSKLNLYQCLAVAKPNYEDIFCLGQHILMDTGQCLIKASGAAMPVEPLPLSSPDATATVKKKGPARRPLTPSPDTTATNNEPP